jgi:hypothetical protein
VTTTDRETLREGATRRGFDPRVARAAAATATTRRSTHRAMADAEPSAYGAETFAEGHWYHELLEDGLALSYRVREDATRRDARGRDDGTMGRERRRDDAGRARGRTDDDDDDDGARDRSRRCCIRGRRSFKRSRSCGRCRSGRFSSRMG